MTEQARAEALLEQAAASGLQVDYDEGFLVVTRSATADQRRADAVEMEQAIIEELGRSLHDIFSFAAGRARAAHAEAFIGRRVYMPAEKIMGVLSNCSASGVEMSYRPDHDQERLANVTSSGRGDAVLVIVDDERLAPAFFAAVDDDRFRRLLERATSVGISIEHDSGFVVVRWRAISAEERAAGEAVLQDLGRSMREVFRYVTAQARGERGAAFVGQRVYVPGFGAFGILSSCGANGNLTVTYFDKRMESQRTVYCRGDDLLVILAGAEEEAEAPSAGQNPEAAWRRLVRRAFRG